MSSVKQIFVLGPPATLKAAGSLRVSILNRLLSSHGGGTDASKPFQDIPGPRGYPLIGTALDYRNDKYTMFRVIQKRFTKFGSIFREKIFPGMPEQVIICKPEDIEAVFRADSEWPGRPEGGEVTKRLMSDAGITKSGVLNSQGEEWYRMRSPMSKFMMVPRKVGEYHEDFNNITLDLLKNIELEKHPDTAVLTDVPKLFFKWSFESVGFFTLGKRLGALSESGDMSPESREFLTVVGKLFDDAMDLVFSLLISQFYRTKKWKDFVSVTRRVNTLAKLFIDEKLAEIEEGDRRALEAASSEEEAPEKVDFITYMVHSGKMSVEEVTVNVIDLLTAGVETTSYTLAWALYSLTTNPEAQEKLRSEIQRVVGSDQIVIPAHFNQMTYLRSVIKETQRLYPLAIFNQRILGRDTILSGYLVPKGTEISMPQIITHRMPELYSEPDKFLPERWDRENKDKLPSMFANLPFGFGPRMCVGRRVAELELFIALTHLIREYRVECLDKEPMGYVMKSLLVPDRQLNLVFENLRP